MAGRRHLDRRNLRMEGRQPGAGALFGKTDAVLGVLPGCLELRVGDAQGVLGWAADRHRSLGDAGIQAGGVGLAGQVQVSQGDGRCSGRGLGLGADSDGQDQGGGGEDGTQHEKYPFVLMRCSESFPGQVKGTLVRPPPLCDESDYAGFPVCGLRSGADGSPTGRRWIADERRNRVVEELNSARRDKSADGLHP